MALLFALSISVNYTISADIIISLSSEERSCKAKQASAGVRPIVSDIQTLQTQRHGVLMCAVLHAVIANPSAMLRFWIDLQ